MPEYSPSNAKVNKVEPMPAGEAKWIRLQKITYTDPSGKSRAWESAERQTRPKGGDCDGVGVVAILHDPSNPTSKPSLLLQKQFRPPIDKVTIEVPSGLIDEGETACQAAIRELKEETGYVATIPDLSRSNDGGFIMHNDPGFCNTNTKMIFVNVDLNDPRNKEPKPELEENEYIETFTLPLDGLWEGLEELDRQGFGIDARVGTLVQGMELARKWKGALGF